MSFFHSSKMNFTSALLLSILVVCASAGRPRVFGKPKFKDFYGKLDANIKVGDAGEPLIITDYLNQNQIIQGQLAAEVDSSLFLGVKSYAGYFRVNDDDNANLFFWFFPNKINFDEFPVLLWLQGGPGSTSMFGLFQEHGPFKLVGNDELALRNTSWTEGASVLYIDQPAGTGFSFTEGKIVSNQTQVGADLYIALQQFFKLFPRLQSNQFFIAGESYGGKYVPAIGYTILKNNPTADLKINLKGLAIGNGWSSPKHQLRYADYLLQHGLVDVDTRNRMFDLEQQAVDAIDQGDYQKASDLMDSDFGGIFSEFNMATDFSNVYNYLIEEMDNSADLWLGNFFQREDVRRAIHVGNTPFSDGSDVYSSLSLDIPKSVAPWVEELLENYRVLLYSGQLDLIVPYPVTIDYIRSLNFSAAEIYKNTPRNTWHVGRRIAGYAKSAGNLTEILVRNAGHLVPLDQPEWALDLINRFLRDQRYT